MITGPALNKVPSGLESQIPGCNQLSAQDRRFHRVWKDGETFHLIRLCYVVVTNDKGESFYRYGLETDNGRAIYLSMLVNTIKHVRGNDGKIKDIQLECDLYTVANKYRSDLHPELKGKGEVWAAEQILNDVRDKTIIVSRTQYYIVPCRIGGRTEERETTFPLFNFV